MVDWIRIAGGPTREHLGAMCMTSPPVGESSALGKQRGPLRYQPTTLGRHCLLPRGDRKRLSCCGPLSAPVCRALATSAAQDRRCRWNRASAARRQTVGAALSRGARRAFAALWSRTKRRPRRPYATAALRRSDDGCSHSVCSKTNFEMPLCVSWHSAAPSHAYGGRFLHKRAPIREPLPRPFPCSTVLSRGPPAYPLPSKPAPVPILDGAYTCRPAACVRAHPRSHLGAGPCVVSVAACQALLACGEHDGASSHPDSESDTPAEARLSKHVLQASRTGSLAGMVPIASAPATWSQVRQRVLCALVCAFLRL
jgi:hypothetical protein